MTTGRINQVAHDRMAVRSRARENATTRHHRHRCAFTPPWHRAAFRTACGTLAYDSRSVKLRSTSAHRMNRTCHSTICLTRLPCEWRKRARFWIATTPERLCESFNRKCAYATLSWPRHGARHGAFEAVTLARSPLVVCSVPERATATTQQGVVGRTLAVRSICATQALAVSPRGEPSKTSTAV